MLRQDHLPLNIYLTLYKIYNEIEEEGEIIESPKWDKETNDNKEDMNSSEEQNKETTS